MRYRAVRRDKPEHAMERLVTQVGGQFGGPRDLMHLHVAVINEATSHATGEIGRPMVFEGRLLTLEMMTLLVYSHRTVSRRA